MCARRCALIVLLLALFSFPHRSAPAGVSESEKPGSDGPACWWAGIPFGRAFHAQSAAYLGQGDVVEEILNSMADRVYPSLHMSLRPGGGTSNSDRRGRVFNFDGNGVFPDIINRSLAFSLDGTLDLLRSIPPGWRTGSIRGIRVRGQIEIDRLKWDQDKGALTLELTSAVAQTITLHIPGTEKIESFQIIDGAVKIDAERKANNSRKVSLPAGEKVKMDIRYAVAGQLR